MYEFLIVFTVTLQCFYLICMSETFSISNCSVLFNIIDQIGPSISQKVKKVRAGSGKLDKSWSKGHNSRLTKSITERHGTL